MLAYHKKPDAGSNVPETCQAVRWDGFESQAQAIIGQHGYIMSYLNDDLGPRIEVEGIADQPDSSVCCKPGEWLCLSKFGYFVLTDDEFNESFE